MQQLLLGAAVLLALASTTAIAQSSGGMEKADTTHGAMGKGMGKMERAMDKPAMAHDAMGKEGKEMKHGAMSPMSHEMGAMLTGVDGHHAAGGVMVMTDGNKATVSLDSSFAVTDAMGAGLYLSMSDMFDMKAVRVAALSKPMGKQSYTVRLPKGAAAQYLLVINESSHAVLAKASLGTSTK